MNSLLESIKKTIRGIMLEVAIVLDALTGGRIRPNHVTLVSLLGHVLLFFAITEGKFAQSALLLTFFGMLDAVDGGLARHQKTASVMGMLNDSTADRLKEMIVYAGVAFWFSEQGNSTGVLYSVLALGVSFAVSYIKAKAEVAKLVADGKPKKDDINRIFGAGIFGYEVRMFVLVIGFLFVEPLIAVSVVLAGASMTLVQRYLVIQKEFDDTN